MMVDQENGRNATSRGAQVGGKAPTDHLFAPASYLLKSLAYLSAFRSCLTGISTAEVLPLNYRRLDLARCSRNDVAFKADGQFRSSMWGRSGRR